MEGIFLKIVLINPPDISVVRQSSSMQGIIFGAPLGIAYIAAVLEQVDFDVEIIDCPGESQERVFGWDEICKAFQRSSPDLVGITTTTPTLMSAIELAKKSKEFFPKVPVVLGGHGTFALEKEILSRVKEVDFVVCREGEETAVELATSYEKGSSLSSVRGICFRRGNMIIETPQRDFIQNLDSIPFPARHLLPMKSYIQPLRYERRRGTTIVTSRGCPFSCVFCASSAFWGHKFRARSAENVVEEIKHLHEVYGVHGLNGFYCGDDNFTADKDRVLKICKLMIEQGLDDLRWSCQARVDCADVELFEKMYKAGCRELEFGVESGSDEILRIIRKGITLDMVKRAVRMAKEADLRAHGNFIIGLPRDTPKTIKQTIDFSEHGGFDTTSFAPTLVYPSTELSKHKNVDWLTFLLEEELANPSWLPFFHPCVPTYAERDKMKAVMKQIVIRKSMKIGLSLKWLAHPLATCRKIYQIIKLWRTS